MRWTLAAAIVIALALVVWIGTTHPASAEDKPAGGLKDADLFHLLENLGLEPEKRNESVFRVTVKQDTWTVPVQLALSNSEEKIWMYALLGEIKEPAKVPAATLLKLLGAHERIAPAHFYMTGDGKQLYCGSAVDNRGVTPAVLRRELDRFSLGVKSTNELWDTTQWFPEAPAPEKGK